MRARSFLLLSGASLLMAKTCVPRRSSSLLISQSSTTMGSTTTEPTITIDSTTTTNSVTTTDATTMDSTTTDANTSTDLTITGSTTATDSTTTPGSTTDSTTATTDSTTTIDSTPTIYSTPTTDSTTTTDSTPTTGTTSMTDTTSTTTESVTTTDSTTSSESTTEAQTTTTTSSVAATTQTVSVATNGDFEDGTESPWASTQIGTISGTVTNNGVQESALRLSSHSGNYFYYFAAHSGLNGNSALPAAGLTVSTCQPVTYYAGAQYVFSSWVAASCSIWSDEGGCDASAVTISYSIGDVSSSAQNVVTSAYTDDYNEYSVTVGNPSPPNSGSTVEACVILTVPADDNIYSYGLQLDDVSVNALVVGQ